MAQASQDEIRDLLIRRLEAVAPDHEIDIVDVEVVGSPKAPTVRVRIDHANEDADPITLDEVSAETAWISDLVDDVDPIEDRYTLEVSSPGMARPLRKPRDFERFAGEDVQLALNVAEGRKRYTGQLKGIADDVVAIKTDEGEFAFPIEDIRSCTIKPRFEKGAKQNAGGSKHKRKK